MAKIIELVGPSGVGKTTLYKSLQNRWDLKYNWAVYHDFRYKRKPRRRFPADYLKAVSKRFKKTGKEIQYYGVKVSSYPKERSFFENYPGFVNRVIDLVEQHCREGFNGEDKRFLTLFFMMETMEHLQGVLEKEDDPRACLMDEGLISRIMHLNSPTFDEPGLEQYLKRMPLPEAVVYLDLQADEIVKRVNKRNRTASVHQGLDENTIMHSTQKARSLMNYALEELKRRGVSVYVFDAQRSLDELTDDLISILEEKGKFY